VPEPSRPRTRRKTPTTYLLRILVAGYLFLLVAWPVSKVVTRTFDSGASSVTDLFGDPDTVHALRLTLVVALSAVVINTVFGVGIALLLVRYRFPGKRVLSPLLDLPLAVSPIVVGLALVLVYGGRSG